MTTDVNHWNTISGIVTAIFDVIDQDGQEIKRSITKNDYLGVNIPGPGSKEGDGYDWVGVEKLREINEGFFQSIGFRVRPTYNPLSDKNETAHFYSAEATSSFFVTRHGTEIICTIIDRNLRPNKEPESIIDKARDVVVGISAIAGFYKLQWQGHTDGLLSDRM